MYRDPSLSLAETVARLEAEVCELRALGGERRERRLVAVTVVSMIIAIHAIIGLVATKVQADRLERSASKRLEARASDLIACVQMVSACSKQVDACHAYRAGVDPADAPR